MKKQGPQKVLIVQAVMKQYRAPFFDRLYHALRREGIDLKVAYGLPPEGKLRNSDESELSCRFGVKVANDWMLNGKLLYQHVMQEALDADLVIVEQANKHIVNYLLMLLSSLGVKKMAFWGHGYNRQADVQGFSEWAKKKMWNKVDWWFAYTHGTAAYLASHGVPPEKITSVQNSFDTEGFRNELDGVSETALRAEKSIMGISDDARLGLFCGSLYNDKRLDFLLDAAHSIKQRRPEFELLLVGGGALSGLAEKAAREHRWVHYAGPLFGIRKAVYFKMADFFLHPGALGLAILDSFAAGMPVLTTENPKHGPEIEYLENGVNGLITPFDVKTFSDAAAGLLDDSEALALLAKGASASAGRYSLDAMVNNFKCGIVECLALGSNPGRARWTIGRHTSA
jgi:glycosyltransferase involved in cell wall biosynthesis